LNYRLQISKKINNKHWSEDVNEVHETTDFHSFEISTGTDSTTEGSIQENKLAIAIVFSM